MKCARLSFVLIAVLQGHFQIVLSSEYCPLFEGKLSWFDRIMYCTGVWAYLVGGITSPMFTAVPLITIWAGIFPIVVNWCALKTALILLKAPFKSMLYPYGACSMLMQALLSVLRSVPARQYIFQG